MFFKLLICVFLILERWPEVEGADVQLMSTNDNFMSVISGFTVRLQCSVFRCGQEKPTVAWYKDEVMIFNSTDFQIASGIDPGNILLQLTTVPDQSHKCSTDDYTLLLRNLTLKDAGKYRCELHRELQQLDFQIDVLENGLKPGFNKNIDYDIASCCIEQGISPLCRPMCKPKEMDMEFFDPTSCKTKDYKNFLFCATNEGKIDFTPCCRQRSVPSFCFDFCSFNFSMLKRSHRLCLYYLPEIFECFSQKQSRPPKAPHGLQIRHARHKLLCWKEAEEKSEGVPIEYSVHVRDVPLLSIPSEERSRRRPLPETRHGKRRERAAKQKPTVVVAHDSSHRDQTDFVRLDQDQIEQRNNEICISLAGLRRGIRYVFYVQSTNEQGTSDPSTAIFAVV